MPKIIKNSNFRVVVEPQDIGNIERMFHKSPQSIEKAVKNRCNDIVDSIKRHVDNVGRVSVEFDSDEICSHCGLEWSEDKTGMPNCCSDAMTEINMSKAVI